MFGPLFNARVDEQVVIRRRDAPDLTYVIAEHHPRYPLNDLSVLQPPRKEQLVLVPAPLGP